jgi:hypothetical protein
VETPEAGTQPSPAIELSLERVKRAWDLILQRVQASSVSLYAMLRESRPTALEGEVLTVTIASNLAFTRAREPGNAELLAAAAEGALGVPFTAVFVAADASTSDPAEPLPVSPPQDYDFTEQIRHAQVTLDAERLPDEP